jgi:hypothetical protein
LNHEVTKARRGRRGGIKERKFVVLELENLPEGLAPGKIKRAERVGFG